MPRISKIELIKLQKRLGADRAIGAKFGITRQAVHVMRKIYGIPAILVDNTARNKKIIAAYGKGTTQGALAKKFDLSVSQIFKIIRDAGAGKNKFARKSPAKKRAAKKK